MKSTGGAWQSPPAWHAAPIATFLTALREHVVGHLAANSPSSMCVWTSATRGFHRSICSLAPALPGIEGAILLEFNIPRMGRRIDAVLLVGPIVFAIEFKIGEDSFRRAAQEQVWDYALGLKNFREASHTAAVVPILVASEAVTTKRSRLHADPDGVYRPIAVGGDTPVELNLVLA